MYITNYSRTVILYLPDSVFCLSAYNDLSQLRLMLRFCPLNFTPQHPVRSKPCLFPSGIPYPPSAKGRGFWQALSRAFRTFFSDGHPVFDILLCSFSEFISSFLLLIVKFDILNFGKIAFLYSKFFHDIFAGICFLFFGSMRFKSSVCFFPEKIFMITFIFLERDHDGFGFVVSDNKQAVLFY